MFLAASSVSFFLVQSTRRIRSSSFLLSVGAIDPAAAVDVNAAATYRSLHTARLSSLISFSAALMELPQAVSFSISACLHHCPKFLSH